MVTKNELTMLRNLPLELKIAKSKLRIEEWIDYFGYNGVYVSFSGGKDSLVLLDLARKVNPNIKAMFIDTGLEYPEIKKYVASFDNVDIIRPEMSYKEVLEVYGYPVVSKEQASYIDDIRNSTETLKLRRLNGDKNGRYKLAKKWHYLLDAPFKISDKCCDVMKKKPAKEYEKQTGRVCMLGTLTEESLLREQQYLRFGCNGFKRDRKISTPIAFWTEQDILRYILNNNLTIAPIYGEIKEDQNGNLYTTKCKRGGCIFCGFGIHKEKYPNRFQLLEKSHPKLHSYCLDNLGFREVFNFMNIPYDSTKKSNR